MNTKPTLYVAALLLLMSAVAVLPSAEAQIAPTCTTTGVATLTPGTLAGPGTIKPITGTDGVYTITFTYTAPSSAETIAPIQVDIRATATNPSYTNVVPSPPVAYVPAFNADQDGFSHPISVNIAVKFSKDAPAFNTETITVFAKAAAGTCVSPANEVSASKSLTVGFYERYSAKFEKQIHKAGQNAQITLPLTIENFGNGDINVKFAIGEGTAKGPVIAVPSLEIVQSTIAGGETNTKTLNINIKTPFKNGYENRQDQLVIDLSGESSDDTAIKLSPLQLTAVIQTQGVYVPGFGAVTMLFAALGSALLARRLRA